MEKVTIIDIAQYCNVSIKTVSRVINHSENVSEETRNKVLSAMKKLGYQVNLLARGLKQNRTNIIIIFVDRHKEEHMSMWHNVMLKYLFRYAKEKGLKVITSPSNGESYLEDETDGFYLLSSGIADGAILLETVHKDKRLEYLEQTKTPYVVFGQPDRENAHSVSLDNYDVGYKGGKYLLERGYKKICFLVGEEKFLSTQFRVKGFLDAIKESGIEYRIIYEVDTKEKAFDTAKDIIENEATEAFFVSGDERALGVYKLLHQKNLNIPGDVAVLGIDNISICEYMYPAMSSMKQDFRQLAMECIDMLDDLLENQDSERERQILIPSEVIEREST